MVHQLAIPADHFDRDAHFIVECPVKRRGVVQVRRLVAYVFMDREGQEAFALQKSAMIKDHYDDADRAHQARLRDAPPVKDGDLVEIEGKPFRFKLVGDYSDCGRFIPA